MSRECMISLVSRWIYARGIQFSVGSIAQFVERWSRNPKMQVQIPLETTNFYRQYQINMNLVSHISEDGSEIEL